jgi:hypothetical protein
MLGRLFDDMSVTILYRHPQRPDEAGVTRVPDDGYAATLKTSWRSVGSKSSRLCPCRPWLPLAIEPGRLHRLNRGADG